MTNKFNVGDKIRFKKEHLNLICEHHGGDQKYHNKESIFTIEKIDKLKNVLIEDGRLKDWWGCGWFELAEGKNDK